MAARKIAISLEDALAAEVEHAAADETDGNVSAWIAQAARERLAATARRRAMDEAIAAFEAEHGVITQDELDTVPWPAE
jgi:metal-responsive CopG/Arc/MetJ family transcriptional regulator